MNHSERRRIEKFLAAAGQKMELSGWRFIISDLPTDAESTAASIARIEGRRVAVLNLHPQFFDFPPTDQKHFLLHELAHLHSMDLVDIVRATLPELLGEPAFASFFEPYRLSVEVMTDTLAYAFADLIDLEV